MIIMDSYEEKERKRVLLEERESKKQRYNDGKLQNQSNAEERKEGILLTFYVGSSHLHADP